jgi:predicted transcriptional regulator
MHPKLTPTQRLMMLALRAADRPLTIDALAAAVDSTASTILDLAPTLITSGLIARQRIGNRTHYSMPLPPPAAAR